MNNSVLTAKYRPQTFAEVAGQDTIKSILSRAAMESKVAPAYLFSGTRGVGKTTIARILAKALNCRKAPVAEPCNTCDQCLAVTRGTAVDVVEIDGASNRGIDDVRRLKEVVGYAAMEGGYKVFIIDEAHMLSREAFNALLKTLEEPPAKVVFILATTESHKFPATIISRCQHFVFKRLSEASLKDHMIKVLQKEEISYEERAVRLIARRGAGSVRDSMSLLGQVLALGDESLSEAAARSVLGLAGSEVFMDMLEAFKQGDALGLSCKLNGILEQGLDMGFFLRELTALWRNLFMLKQAGEAALDVVDLPEDEAKKCLESCQGFSLQHIHAAWQMTIDGQRRVLTSLEPALGLELLLLNIAMLPKLLSLEKISGLARRKISESGSGSPVNSGNSSSQNSGQIAPAAGPEPKLLSAQACFSGVAEDNTTAQSAPAGGNNEIKISNEAAEVQAEEAKLPEKKKLTDFYSGGDKNPADDYNPDIPEEQDCNEAEIQAALANMADWNERQLPVRDGLSADIREHTAESGPASAEVGVFISQVPGAEQALPENENISAQDNNAELKELEWADILPALSIDLEAGLDSLLKRVTPFQRGNQIFLTAQDSFSAELLKSTDNMQVLSELFNAYCGKKAEIEITAPLVRRKSRDELQEQVLAHFAVKGMQEVFGARIIDYGQQYRQ